LGAVTPGYAHAVAARPLPRGPHSLDRQQVIDSQRGRMLEGIAAAVADKGYAATTVADVVQRAGVSRKTFYEHFTDKEHCFLDAWETGVRVIFEAIRDSQRGAAGPVERMRLGLRAYLRTLAENPAFARSFLIEVVAAGPRAEQRRAEVHERFAELFATQHEIARRERPELPDVPRTICRAAVGAVNEIVSDRVRSGRTADLPALEDEILHLELVLFAGHDVAAAAARG
jgi:AcrR family transcriptional regulator